MFSRLFDYLRVALVSALGALALAGIAQGILALLTPPVPEPVVQCQPTVLMLALDKSGSMREPDKVDKLTPVQNAVRQFVSKASEDDCASQKQFGLVTFNKDATLDIAPTSDISQFEGAVSSINPDGSTIIENGLNLATQTLQNESFNGWTKVMFLLTDAENYGSDTENFRQALKNVKSAGIDLRAVVTDASDEAGLNVLIEELTETKVTKTGETGMGESFFQQAQEVVEQSYSIINPERKLPAWMSYLHTGLWTGLVTAGITLALLIYFNMFNKRKRVLSDKEGLTIFFGLLLGLGIGILLQYLFSIEVVKTALTGQGNFFARHAMDIIIWTLIGSLLAAGLAGFKLLPNLKFLSALGFGLLGGVIAGLLYSLSKEVFPNSVVASLIGATALGLCFGFAVNLLNDAATQFPLWLRVFYTSDKVYRYHPLGTTPLTIGSGRDVDIYVHGDHEKIWQFWVEGGKIMINNLIANKVRTLSFREIAEKGSIELKGMILKIVNDKGPEKGKSPVISDAG